MEDVSEKGVDQIRALLGLTELVTNVNIPNQGLFRKRFSFGVSNFAFANDPLVTCGLESARKLFDAMCENT